MSSKPTYNLNPSNPSWTPPALACNTHCHIMGPVDRFPYPANRTYTPQTEAPKEALFALHDQMGFDRCVMVQAGCHGFDNSAVADAIQTKNGSYLGVALLPVETDVTELKRHYDQGFRGVRFNFMQHLGKGAAIEEVVAMTPRLAEAGLHLQVHMENELIETLAPELKRSAVPVVIDHMGRVDASKGLEQPAFTALRNLLEDKNFWVKVSGSERCSRQGPPYSDAIPFARTLVAEFGDRVVWGIDWPHPNFDGPIPDDGALVDLICEMAP
ncbi:MAG: amidohydrolase family protein, partial [Rhodospirillales bacterium]|nr:amidohydrolase family protein [Rhodospirillales bacterium]